MPTSTRRFTLGVLAFSLISTPVAVAGVAASAPADRGPGARVDSTVHADSNGKRYVVDPRANLTHRRATPTVTPYPLNQTFLLHSKAGSQHTIYLDFDGTDVTGTGWNAIGVTPGFQQGWSLDGDWSTFNDAERTAIQSIWQRVSEDYAPFDVDVTTLDPGDAAIDRADAGDPVFGTRALISQSSQAWDALCTQLCGGIAYIDVFDVPDNHAGYQPAWVFADGLSNDTKAIAEATSHEVGHNFGLSHDGNASQGYDEGHGSWAPIMGSAYDRPISQWSKGDYSGANNQQDDLATIAIDGAPLRADESATLPTGAAYITTRLDTDTYDLGSCSGPVNLTANPAPTSPNLDIRLSLLDASNATITSDDPPSAQTSSDTASGMGAAISTSVPAGTYKVKVDGVGNGTAVTGYDDYGSVGAYTLTVTGSCVTGPGITVPPGPPSIGRAASGAKGGRSTATATWLPPVDDGGAPILKYRVVAYRLNSSGGVVGSVRSALLSPTARSLKMKLAKGRWRFGVVALNSAGEGPVSGKSNAVTAR
ncbi:zinc-dependent metalloprotease family protein [Nocardioides sp.]|uniref:zinc-dependent metalloprotease family protein n=1 Tax=Nocardioides sp. TaxID=35761 RepID=UPI0031FE8887|nr:Fibronectin type domain protein [Nocardioides sp.]